jgi:hypothetical protein
MGETEPAIGVPWEVVAQLKAAQGIQNLGPDVLDQAHTLIAYYGTGGANTEDIGVGDGVKFFKELITALGALGQESSIPVLRQALEYGMFEHQLAAAQALESIASSEALNALLHPTQGLRIDGEVQRRILQAVANIGNPTAADAVFSKLPQFDSFTRERAIGALATLGDKRAVPLLRQLLTLEDLPSRETMLPYAKLLMSFGDPFALLVVVRQYWTYNAVVEKIPYKPTKKEQHKRSSGEVASFVAEIPSWAKDFLPVLEQMARFWTRQRFPREVRAAAQDAIRRIRRT